MKIKDFKFNTGKRISIEIGTQLQIQIDGVAFQYISTLIGMEPDKYLIINAPMALLGYARHKLYIGSKIVVRYLYKGSTFGFKSKLIDGLYEPLKLLFVGYPEVIEEYNLRSGERIDCVIPIKIKINNDKIDGVIVDINEMGCCCVAIKGDEDKELSFVQIDEQATLMCQFPQIEGEHAILGKIRNIRRDKKQMILGIMFHENDPEIENIIGQYILAIKDLFK
ncbi:MAG: flagellar brake protein [Desulfobacteraceae bacterium]|nr:MAG: flagellar brake protein [Desulfobacteraceae bacterium]